MDLPVSFLFVLLYLVFCIAIAACTSDKKIGFTTTLFICIFLSPIIGIIAVLVSPSNKKDFIKEQQAADMLAMQKEQTDLMKKQYTSTPLDELEKLSRLKNDGTITAEEFASMKAKILA